MNGVDVFYLFFNWPFGEVWPVLLGLTLFGALGGIIYIIRRLS